MVTNFGHTRTHKMTNVWEKACQKKNHVPQKHSKVETKFYSINFVGATSLDCLDFSACKVSKACE